jgi:phenylacetate-CoA ligase
VRCEVRVGHEQEWPAVQTRLAADLAAAIEGLAIPVVEAPRGSLPRFELKAKRVKDERVVKGAQR